MYIFAQKANVISHFPKKKCFPHSGISFVDLYTLIKMFNLFRFSYGNGIKVKIKQNYMMEKLYW